jgi:hypothetical protein
VLQALIGIESFKKFFMLTEYSEDEQPDPIKFIANRLLSRTWQDYFRPELSYHKEEILSIDIDYLHPYLSNNRLQPSLSIDAAKLFEFLSKSSSLEEKPVFMLPFDSERQVHDMNQKDVDKDTRFSEFYRIANCSKMSSQRSMLFVDSTECPNDHVVE